MSFLQVLRQNLNLVCHAGTTTERFTAKIAGVYQFTAKILFNKSPFYAALRYTHFDTNVLTLALSYPKNINTTYATHTVTLVIPMKVGQYLYPTLEGSGYVQINDAVWSSFSGILFKSL
jgi:hypothetical protein